MVRAGLSARLFAAAAATAALAPLALARQESLAPRARSEALEWSALPALPDPIGLGGPFAGVSGEALIVAGGANFPELPPWEGGHKVWHGGLWVLAAPDAEWRAAGRLEPPLAYGASVSTPGGVLLIGGCNVEVVSDRVRQLVWDGARIRFEELPPLPLPTCFCAAALVDGDVYVVPGQETGDPTSLIDAFWTLDLGVPASERGWRALPPCPGGARIKAVAAAQRDGEGTEQLFLFSGEVPSAGAGGAIARAYRRDAWRFDPRAVEWTRLADPPRPVAAGSAAAFGQAHVLCFSGSTGEHIGEPLADQPGFPAAVLAYHSVTDTWVEAGAMPVGVVTTNAVSWRERIAIPSGEVRPGVRTPRVQAVERARGRSGFGPIDYATLGGYVAAVIAMGLVFSRREKTTRDYFLAGGRIPWWAAGLSIYATQLSAITFLSTPALAWATDWSVWPGYFAILLMAPVVIHFYLPFFRRLNVTTAYEYLERRFGLAVRLYGSLSFILFQVARTAIVVYLPSLALSTVTGIDVHLCIALIGVLATLYTVLGGMEAVVWTDVLQTLVLWGGMLFALALAADGAGGVEAAWRTIAAEGKATIWRGGLSFTELATWSILVGSFFLQFGPYTTDQATVQRYLTTRDERSAARGILLNGLLSVPVGLLFFLLGAFLFAFYRAHPGALAIGMQNDEVFPLFVATQMPPGLSGLVIAGVFAASMSTLDSSMHAIATSLTTDFYRRLARGVEEPAALRFARLATAAAGLAATLAAWLLASFDIRSVFLFFQQVLGLLGSGLAGVFFLGLFSRRASSAGALSGAAVSTALLAWITWRTPAHFYLYSVIGFASCVLAGLAVSGVVPTRRSELAGLTWWTRPRARDGAAS